VEIVPPSSNPRPTPEPKARDQAAKLVGTNPRPASHLPCPPITASPGIDRPFATGRGPLPCAASTSAVISSGPRSRSRPAGPPPAI
jgi:hypothetical protein